MKSEFKPLLQQLLDIQAYTGNGGGHARLTPEGIYLYGFCVVFMVLLFTYLIYQLFLRKLHAPATPLEGSPSAR